MIDEFQNNDSIQVFQASPLAYLASNEEPKRACKVDLHSDREIITRALKDSDVSIDYEIATAERVGAFLANGAGKAMHLSCHGHGPYLALEEDDGWGELHLLDSSVLKDWIASGGNQLQFVCVSASNSLSLGKAIAEAGVPHVISYDKETTTLDYGTTVNITKSLYEALSSGSTVQQAFDRAGSELPGSSGFGQLCLFPEDGNHDVAIFAPDPRALISRRQASTDTEFADFVVLPDGFVCDELEMYRLIQEIKTSRLVNVTGPAGIGKSTLVKECCRYLNDRQTVVNLDEIICKCVYDDVDEQDCHGESVLDACFRSVFQSWRSASIETPNVTDLECSDQIFEYFGKKRALLVLDAKCLLLSGIKNMNSFLDSLLAETKYLKVIVIYGAGMHPRNDATGLYIASSVAVDGLNMESTVKLFASCCAHVRNRACPFVCTGPEFWRLLAPNDPSLGHLSKRHRAILRLLGGSNPKNVSLVASKITIDHYLALTDLGSFESLDLFQTRAELMLLAFEYKRRISGLRANGETEARLVLERRLKAVKTLMEEFPDGKTLKDELEKKYIEVFLCEKQSKEIWYSKRAELEKVETLIENEEHSIVSMLTDSQSRFPRARILRNGLIETDADDLVSHGASKGQSSSMALDIEVSPDVLGSKHGVEACLKLLKQKRHELVSAQLYDKAEVLDFSLCLLQELNFFRSSTSDLEVLKRKLGGALNHFRLRCRDWERAKSSYKMLLVVKNAINKERKSRSQSPPSVTMATSGVIRITYRTGEDSAAENNGSVFFGLLGSVLDVR